MHPRLNFLLNPFLLSLWATVPFLFLLPVKESRYELKPLGQGTYNSDIQYSYADLDEDGNSEVIAVFTNSLGQAGLTVSGNNGFLSQWNFNGNFAFAQNDFMITADCDHDQTHEIFVFTLSGDSVMLNLIPDYKNTLTNRFFVCRVGSRNGKTDPYIIGGGQEDLDGDGTGELIFAVGTGFSLQPRNVFAFNLKEKSFNVSPSSGYFLNDLILEDITGDSTREIIPYSYAAENIRDTVIPFPDSLSWLMVLDKNLKFAFDPVSFPYAFSSLLPFVIRSENSRERLAALYRPFDNLDDSARIFLFDSAGKIIRTIRLPGNPAQALSYNDNKNHPVILVNFRNHGLSLYDENFGLIKEAELTGTNQLTLIDADDNGHEEILSLDIFERRLTVFRNDLKFPVSQTFEGDGEKKILLSLIRKKGEPPRLYMQFGKSFNLFQYRYNTLWWVHYARYAAIYALLLLFILLSRKLQRDQIRKKQETERKIIDLQLKLVSNQLDPHFIMNCINAIMASNTLDQKEKVMSQLMHFARLHRSLLMQSDRIMISLQEETDFLNDYLALEKYRYPDRFEYRLQIDPDVNTDVLVPKMLLQIYSENALKHGILQLEDKQGLLEISITMKEDLLIEIRDNGIGRKAASGKSASTGKGMVLMEQYYELLEKLNVARLRHEVEDLYDSGGLSGGTLVRIIVERNE